MRSRSIEFGQNFLRSSATARLVVEIADPPEDTLCVDLGAGSGIITDACRRIGRRVLAVEAESRLASRLHAKYRDDADVTVVQDKLASVRLPGEPFVITANPPFNQSTTLIRRWVAEDNFRAGGIVVQRQFARKLAGMYGATKLSLALSPYFAVTIEKELESTDFRPQPKVPTVIMRIAREDAGLGFPWSKRRPYWLFINYLFERSHPTVADALRPLDLRALPPRLRDTMVRTLDAAAAIEIFDRLCADNRGNTRKVTAFDSRLDSGRRLNLGSHGEPPPHPPRCRRLPPVLGVPPLPR